MASTIVRPPAATPAGDGNKPSSIARATGLMMVTVLLSRVLGVTRDAIISHYFGLSPQTDAYNAAFTVPDLLFYLLQSGALSSTIVPILTEFRQQGRDKAADKTVSVVASTIFVFIGLLICIMWINARALTIMLNPGFDAPTIALAVPLTRVLLPAQLFFFLGGLMMGVLYSRKQFLIPALGPVIYNSGIIIGGVLLRPIFARLLGPDRAIEGLVWGAIGGAFFGNFLLPYLAVLRLGVKLRPSLDVTHPAAMKVWRMLLPIGLGVSLPNIDQMVNKAFASYLGHGDTTAIMNAYRLMLLPIGIFAQAMALAVFPTLSSQAAEKNLGAMRKTMNQSLRNILFLTVPASALMLLLAEPVVTFLLQGGKYTHADTLVTAPALRALSLGIFAWSCQSLLTRGFYALQNSKIPVISGAIVSVLFVGMNVWVVKPVLGVKARVETYTRQAALLDQQVFLLEPLVQPMLDVQTQVGEAQSALTGSGAGQSAAPTLSIAGGSISALALQTQAALTDAQTRLDAQNLQVVAAQDELEVRASRAVWELGLTTSLAAAIHMTALFFLLRRRLSGLQTRRLLSSVSGILAGTLALSAVTWLVLAVCKTAFEGSVYPAKLTALLTLSAAGLCGIAAYALVAKLLKLSELQSAIGLIRRRRG